MSVGEWKETSLGDVSIDIAYGYTASAKTEKVGPKFLRITDIVGGLNWSTVPYCEIDSKNTDRYKLNVGDIVIARTGATTGSTEIIKDKIDAVFASYLIRFKIDQAKADPFFVGYAVKSNLWKEYVSSIIGGSAQPGANAKQFADFKFPLPPLNIQKKIASILSSIDEKIELNRQTAQTLEAIAQAIFKEWFVDFNFPGATGEMQESELGQIPKGWRIGKLGEVCDLVYGKALKAENRKHGEYPVVGSSGIVDFHNEYLVSAPGIVIGRKGTIGEVTWLHKNFYPIDTTFYIRDKLGVDGLHFHYFLLKDQDFKKIASDSAVPGLNRNHAMDNRVIIPVTSIIETFHHLTNTIFEAKYEVEQQAITLTRLRDNLLPKLMKGEIAIYN